MSLIRQEYMVPLPDPVSVSEKVQNVIDGLRRFNHVKLRIVICKTMSSGFYMAMFGDRNPIPVESVLSGCRERCEVCRSTGIDALYSYTINKLKEKGLLDKNYKKICCVCKDKQINGVW